MSSSILQSKVQSKLWRSVAVSLLLSVSAVAAPSRAEILEQVAGPAASAKHRDGAYDKQSADFQHDLTFFCLQGTGLTQGRFDRRVMLFCQSGHWQAQMRANAAHARNRPLDRDRIGLDEQALMQRQ